MDHDDTKCVYIKETLLQQLEKDKRGLKWQLARATKAAEARAADVAAYEAKVKDLMTIVEMNKSVAEKAIKRTYTKEAQLQALTKEKIALEQHVTERQQRAFDKAWTAMRARSRWRRKRDWLQRWARTTRHLRQVRAAIRTLARYHRLRWVRVAWERWSRRSCGTGSRAWAAIYPAHLPAQSASSCLRLRVRMRRETKRLCFHAWRLQCSLHQRKRLLRVAQHFARVRLIRRCMRKWRAIALARVQFVRSAVRRRERTRALVLECWCQWTQRQMVRRRALQGVMARRQRAFVRWGWSTLRIKTLEMFTAQWARALENAQQALDEQKIAYALQQDAALRELHESTTAQQHGYDKLRELQLQQLQINRTLETKRWHFMSWKWRVLRRRATEQVASAFVRSQCQARRKRSVFLAWKHQSAHAGAQRAARVHVQRQTQRGCLRRIFRAFASLCQRERLRRRVVARLFQRKRATLVRRAVWRWQAFAAVEETQAGALLEHRQLVHSLRTEQFTWQQELERAVKLAAACRVRCALLMGDQHRAAATRRVLLQWRRKVQRRRQCSRVLNKLQWIVGRSHTGAAFRRWQRGSAWTQRWHEHLRRVAIQQHRARVVRVFAAWAAFSHASVRAKWAMERQRQTLSLWRLEHRQQRVRAMLLYHTCRRAALRQQLVALRRWRERMECQREAVYAAEQRLLQLHHHVFHQWARFVKCSLSTQRRQAAMIDRAQAAELVRTLQRATLTAWSAHVRKRRAQGALLARFAAAKRGPTTLLHIAFDRWGTHVRLLQRRRKTLQRVVYRRGRAIVQSALVTWFRRAKHGNSHTTVPFEWRNREATMLANMRQRHRVRSCFAAWYARACVLRCLRRNFVNFLERQQLRRTQAVFSQWAHVGVPRARAQRFALRSLLLRQRRARIMDAVRMWSRTCWAAANEAQQAQSRKMLLRVQDKTLAKIRQALAHKDQRFCWTAWKQLVVQGKAQRAACARAAAARVTAIMTNCFRWWKKQWALRARLTTLQRLARRQHAFIALARWKSRHRTLVIHSNAAAVLLRHSRKFQLRASWQHWKRRDHQFQRAAMAGEHQRAVDMARGFMERLLVRRSTRATLGLIFNEWKRVAAGWHAQRRAVVLLLIDQDRRNLQQRVRHWQQFAAQSVWAKGVLKQLLVRRYTMTLRDAFGRWKYDDLHARYKQQLDRTVAALEQHKLINARHVAMVMYMGWKRPCLASCFTGWKITVVDEKRAMTRKLTDHALRRAQQALAQAFQLWRANGAHLRAVRIRNQEALVRRTRDALTTRWTTWKLHAQQRGRVRKALTRLCAVCQAFHLRQAMSAFRARRLEAYRHQSMVVALSAQNALAQQKKEHLKQQMLFMLIAKQTKNLHGIFVGWKLAVATRKHTTRLVQSFQRRLQRRVRAQAFRAWRMISSKQHYQRQALARWTVTQSQRLLRGGFAAWTAMIVDRRRAKWLLWRALLHKHAMTLYLAWEQWRALVVSAQQQAIEEQHMQLRRASVQQGHQLEVMEREHELLTLEAAQLRRSIHNAQQSHLGLLCRRLERWVSDQEQRAVRARFERWLDWTTKCRVAAWLVDRVANKRVRRVFQRWQRVTVVLRITHSKETTRRQSMSKVALLVNNSTAQTTKRKAWLLWRTFVTKQRLKKQHVQALQATHAREYALLLRATWWQWKLQVQTSRANQHKALAIAARQRRWRTLRRNFDAWKQCLSVQRRQCDGARRLALVLQARLQLQLRRRWDSWLRATTTTVLTQTQAQVLMMELEQWNSTTQHSLNQVVLQAFSNWKFYVAREHIRRDTLLQLYRPRHGPLAQCFRRWQKVVNERRSRARTRLQPVLCIQTTYGRRCTGKTSGLVCTYGHYRRCLQTRWRLQHARSVQHVRWRRVLGLSLLLRALTRHYARCVRRSLWLWFCKVQRVSHALRSLPLQPIVSWRRTRLDLASLALITLVRDVAALHAAVFAEQQLRPFRSLQLILAVHRRAMLRRGLSGLLAMTKRRKPARLQTPTALSRRVNGQSAPVLLLPPRVTAATRAFAEKLAFAVMRPWFRRWKNQYVHAALADAETAQVKLLLALRDISSYRTTLDAYADAQTK